MTLPVIYIHWGNEPRYELSTVIARARASGNNAILLGDKTNGSDDLIEHYSAGVREFERVYAHLSTNHWEFEFKCFARWFILRDFMEINGTPRVLYCDTDVLLFGDAQREWETNFKKDDFTLSLGSSAATSYWTQNAIDWFCNFVMSTYSETSQGLYLEMLRIYLEMRRQNLAGGCSDMLLLKWYRENTKWRCGEMSNIRDETTWDHRISSDDGFEMRDGIKHIEFRDGNPYGFIVSTGDAVRLNALHFQGDKKCLIKEYARL